MSRVRVAAVCAAVLMAAGCSSDQAAAPAPSTTSASTTSTTSTTSIPTTSTAAPTTTTSQAPPPPTTTEAPGPPTSPRVWPRYEPLPGVKGYAALTGLPADDATAALPVVAVKIDNHPSARPQWGLDEADVIVEENVESLTRFIALFHSRQPSMVGPVRSVRTSDTPVLAALNRPVLGWSGGNAGVIAEVNAAADAGVIVDGGVYTEGSCYHREGSRSAPHNLVFDPNCGREASPTAGAARPIFAFGEPATPRAEGRVIDVEMDGVRVAWEYDEACRRYQQGDRYSYLRNGRTPPRTPMGVSDAT